GAVIVLEVDRDWEFGGAVLCRRVRDDLVERHVAVEPPEREGEARARGRERLEPERRQYPRRAGVPRVRDHERRARVERLERAGLLLLAPHQTSLCCVAQRVSSWRVESCSLRSTFETWLSTVLTEMWSRSAISLYM